MPGNFCVKNSRTLYPQILHQVLKLIGLGFWAYFSDGSNQFDAFIVAASLAEFTYEMAVEYQSGLTTLLSRAFWPHQRCSSGSNPMTGSSIRPQIVPPRAWTAAPPRWGGRTSSSTASVARQSSARSLVRVAHQGRMCAVKLCGRIRCCRCSTGSLSWCLWPKCA